MKLEKIKIGDSVRGKTTKRIYKVIGLNLQADYYEDAILLFSDTNKEVPYTRVQFEHHFTLVK